MVQADFVTIDLKGFGIFGSGQYGTAVGGMGRGLVVRGGTIYSFFTAIRGGDSLVVEQMRVVNNAIGVDASTGGSASVKDSVFNDNTQWGVSVTNGVVANNSFNRNGTGVSAGQYGWYPGSGATITNNTFSQRSEEHTSELQSRGHLVCRLLLEKKKKKKKHNKDTKKTNK